MSREIAVAALVIGVLIIGGADNPNYTKCHDAGVGKGLRGNELSQFELQCLGFQPMTVSVSEAVPAGAKDHLIGVWYSANADCSSKGLPTVRVTGAPAHGMVRVQTGSNLPNSPSGPGGCTLSTEVLYTPQPGFVEMDQ